MASGPICPLMLFSMYLRRSWRPAIGGLARLRLLRALAAARLEDARALLGRVRLLRGAAAAEAPHRRARLGVDVLLAAERERAELVGVDEMRRALAAGNAVEV